MEVPGGHQNKALVCLYEALGTATLLLAINWTNGGNAYAIAITIFAAIVVFGSVSGAHFNPAVTIAVLIKNGKIAKDLPFAVMIIVSQIVGGFIGVLTAFTSLSKYTTQDGGINWKTRQIAVLCPPIIQTTAGLGDDPCDPTDFVFEIFLVEFVCTALFVSLFMTIKYHTPSNEGLLGAASVATTLFGMINLSAGITGACLNPAVGFCQSVVQSKMIDSTLPYIDG